MPSSCSWPSCWSSSERGGSGVTASATRTRTPGADRSTGALPFVVGLTHGLAGSGALVAAIGAAQPSPALGLFTMALYGVGAGLGMVLLAGVFGLTLGRAA
jgi:hypothetical protein